MKNVANGEIIRTSVKPYGIVLFALMEYAELSPLARLVACWIESKPEGWKIIPSNIQEHLSISEKQWLSARRQLIKAGILRHTKYRTETGQWKWKSEFSIAPILDTTPPFTAHGKPADIEVRVKNKDIQKAEGFVARAGKPQSSNLRSPPKANQASLDDLKKLHLSHVLTNLGIEEWWEEGSYLRWPDRCRARCEEDGHWLWLK